MSEEAVGGQTYEMKYKFSVDDSKLMQSGKDQAKVFEQAQKAAENFQKSAQGGKDSYLLYAIGEARKIREQFSKLEIDQERFNAKYAQQQTFLERMKGAGAVIGGKKSAEGEAEGALGSLAGVAKIIGGLVAVNELFKSATEFGEMQQRGYGDWVEHTKEMGKGIWGIGTAIRYADFVTGTSERDRNAVRNAERSQLTVQQYAMRTDHNNEVAAINAARYSASIGIGAYSQQIAAWQAKPDQLYDPARIALQSQFGRQAGNAAYGPISGAQEALAAAQIRERQVTAEIREKQIEVERHQKEVSVMENRRREAQARYDKINGESPEEEEDWSRGPRHAGRYIRSHFSGVAAERTNEATHAKEATDMLTIAAKNLENSTRNLRDLESKRTGASKETEQASLQVRRAQANAYRADLEYQYASSKGFLFSNQFEQRNVDQAMRAVRQYGQNTPDDIKAIASRHPDYDRFVTAQTDKSLFTNKYLQDYNRDFGIRGPADNQRRIQELGGSDREERIDDLKIEQNFQKNTAAALERFLGRIEAAFIQALDATGKSFGANQIHRQQLNNVTGS